MPDENSSQQAVSSEDVSQPAPSIDFPVEPTAPEPPVQTGPAESEPLEPSDNRLTESEADPIPIIPPSTASVISVPDASSSATPIQNNPNSTPIPTPVLAPDHSSSAY